MSETIKYRPWAEPGAAELMLVPNWIEQAEPGGVPDEIRADYLTCYEGDRFAESMRYVRRYPEELPVLAQLLPHITVPVMIINGRHDRVVPLVNAEFLDERLPISRLVIVDAGHFVWEEAPIEYASSILNFITQ